MRKPLQFKGLRIPSPVRLLHFDTFSNYRTSRLTQDEMVATRGGCRKNGGIAQRERSSCRRRRAKVGVWLAQLKSWNRWGTRNASAFLIGFCDSSAATENELLNLGRFPAATSFEPRGTSLSGCQLPPSRARRKEPESEPFAFPGCATLRVQRYKTPSPEVRPSTPSGRTFFVRAWN